MRQEIEEIQLCPSLHEFHRRQMRREEKEEKKQTRKISQVIKGCTCPLVVFVLHSSNPGA